VLEPDFSFTSARYIQVKGVCLTAGQGLPVIHSAVGQHVSSASRRLGEMKTDKDDVNQLLNALKWTFASNLFSYHTDCPQIEKFGWLKSLISWLLRPNTWWIWRPYIRRSWMIFSMRKNRTALFLPWLQKSATCVDHFTTPSLGAVHSSLYPTS
jgi:hypothetical protein